ncbi:YopX family protein [Fructobacillus tropaeoli]|uniref:YopX protein domain-containing protein n=1 Tax=Fructobacillus tropaeoli TaxID=709323 RepID=A0A3F3HEA1_9LACO|nr:YopX family protein [Fructobacillus tropaeoli]QHJ83526.1 MAG: hypothetical protein [Caudoviricetes sp.]GAP05090.1 hypothetical protein FTRO_0450010 [Fructobacillus tropaeoli]
MREIKFRIWDENCEEWLNQDEHVIYADNGDVGEYDDDELVESIVHNTVVEQFTGLHDKNGQEIYEGDIMKCVARGSNDIFIMKVAYFNDCAMFCVHSNSHQRRGLSVAFYESEVIGNIHENKELLEKNNEKLR